MVQEPRMLSQGVPNGVADWSAAIIRVRLSPHYRHTNGHEFLTFRANRRHLIDGQHRPACACRFCCAAAVAANAKAEQREHQDESHGPFPFTMRRTLACCKGEHAPRLVMMPTPSQAALVYRRRN